MKVISIDPAWGRPYAVATFEDGIFKDCSLVEISNIGWVLSRNAKIKKDVIVIVEEGYIGVNKKNARNICYAVGGIIAFCEYFQVKYETMSIGKWESEFYLIGQTDKMKSIAMKHWTSKITNSAIDNMDKQCAILIGQAWINKNEKSII